MSEPYNTTDKLIGWITDYLSTGGLFNPELANHDAVRDLLMDCRSELSAAKERIAELEKTVRMMSEPA